jgi:serine/threonine protein kinase/formylglycine-generating enzyme required for sulfatase activity
MPDQRRVATSRQVCYYQRGSTTTARPNPEAPVNQQPDPVRTVPEPEGQAVAPAEPLAGDHPSHIGRYRVEKLLGEGGFGRVYLAHDDQLRRPVAIKVPRPERACQPGYADSYLAEARILARLDHPHIVPVHDIGQTADGLPFVISKFIEGTDLAQQIRQGRPLSTAAADLVATVAEALHYAHRQGLVHRDIKPGNILLDTGGKPYVADFGLALREEDFGKGAGFAGTPVYMSPEQARGEGHRVDGRSDLFSLGVVFYELLTGRRPFRGETRDELLEQIIAVEPRPLRQVDDSIPRELERICLKALAKRATERYPTALDLADDLRHFLAASPPPVPRTVPAVVPVAEAVLPTPTPPVKSEPESGPVRIVPRGLRSFDAQDADFFLELLPGPRDRDGLPDSIRFWKARVEETDPDQTFPVGLLYGPSGCGKSSLVKAGLLPRLAGHVLAVYVEAAADQTEARLLAGLAKRCPGLPTAGGVKEALAALRRGQGLPAGKKVLIVLDQFEQWLHAQKGAADSELVQALRQCDGGRVQCLVLVRDDFWLAVSRFMGDLEVELVQGHNMALVDLFDAAHARKVLGAFGRAFGKLPEQAGERTKEQQGFVEQAVSGLAQDGKVVSVRLALFAEMMKGKVWAPATLKAVGGMEGVGVTFLEETFSAATAPPPHRLHQRAAQAVLKALLPESGTDIKGQMRSREELLQASGYAARPRAFDELLRILDGGLRLVTPTDPEGTETRSASAGTTQARSASAGTTQARSASEGAADVPALALRACEGERYYQLTHDYLVHSLRHWLTRKQKETRRGRAELRLAERASLWNAKPENRHLPAWWEWLNIRCFTRKRDWTAPQRQMMRWAGRYHALRGTALLLLVLLLGWGGVEGYRWLRAQSLVESLVTAETGDVPSLVGQLSGYRRWANPRLLRHLQTSPEDTKEHLHASLALAPVDEAQVAYLSQRLLRAGPAELLAIRTTLQPYQQALQERLWALLQDRTKAPGERLRAACALAAYAEDDGRWEGVSGDVVATLAAENALVIGRWAEALRPVRRSLLPPLAEMLLAEGRDATQRRTITGLYAGYAEDQPDAYARLEKTLAEESKPDAAAEAKLALARRQANAAVALAAMGRWEKVTPLLRHRPDPTVRSYLIDRLASGGVEAQALTVLLGAEQEVSVRRALLLALGEYGQDGRPLPEQEVWAPRLAELYQTDPDPGIHGAVDWLLRRWRQAERLAEIDRGLLQRDQELARSGRQPPAGRRWYVNGQGQTLVLVAPGEFSMGEGQERVQRTIDHPFALAGREVTVAEFLRFRKEHQYVKEYAPTLDCPMHNVSWYDAAAYCNWLSKEEGISEDQWCYVRNGKGEYAEGMKVPADYVRRTGYRLPTEAEWEYACRAGSATTWAHGEAEELLGKYAWFIGNASSKSHPGAELRPNDLGLFDLCGNAWEWCQDRYGELKPKEPEKDEKQKEDVEDIVDNKSSRLLRGGAFDGPMDVRPAARDRGAPAGRFSVGGFRPARTFR